MEKDMIINGFRIGEYSFDPDKVIEEVEMKYSEGMNLAAISTNHFKGDAIPQHYFIEWAKYFTERKIYFSFNGGGYRKEAGYTKETCRAMKEIAGKYFLYHALGEYGSTYSCKGSGYTPTPIRKWNDLEDAKNFYIRKVKEGIDEVSCDGLLDVTVVESTSMTMYNCEAGCTLPFVEFWPGDVEISAAFTRGAALSFNRPMWGSYMAHEWYGGLRWDEMKMKRFKMGYDYGYMQGSSVFLNESGDEKTGSHSGESWGYDHPTTKRYRDVMADFAKFTLEDSRPAGGPKVKVAFVRGHLDGYSYRHSGGSLWRGHMQKEFGYSESEYAWRLLEKLQTKRRWCDVHNYGEEDLSNAPAYGMYDVIAAEASLETLSKYDYLIFIGWNTMTDELYKKLKSYVAGGGKIFMTAAHLNTSKKRDGIIRLYNDGKVSDLLGCDLDTEYSYESEDGTKFVKSIIPNLYYPTLKFRCGDPYFAEGYALYPKVTLSGGVASGRLSNRFNDGDVEGMPVSLVENKLGEGYTILMTALEFPTGAIQPMYENILREIFVSTQREASVRVHGGDALRFSVYEGDKVYLLNTDFDHPTSATIDYSTHKVSFTLEPCEFKAVEKTEA